MVFDLGRAMRKKEEFESARLMDFEFRRRSRATRQLVRALGLPEAEAVALVATLGEEATCSRLAAMAGLPVEAVAEQYRQHLAAAHAALVEERGDPTPHRLG